MEEHTQERGRTVSGSKPSISMFSIRIAEEALTCWLEHFFAVVERAKENTEDD